MQNHVGLHPGRRVNGHRFRPVPTLAPRDVEVVVEPVDFEGGPDLVHEWGLQSFPASDPPANW
jgi:hypothetical protein